MYTNRSLDFLLEAQLLNSVVLTKIRITKIVCSNFKFEILFLNPFPLVLFQHVDGVIGEGGGWILQIDFWAPLANNLDILLTIKMVCATLVTNCTNCA